MTLFVMGSPDAFQNESAYNGTECRIVSVRGKRENNSERRGQNSDFTFYFLFIFFLALILFTWRVVSGEREFSCVLCACQEIVNFIFFLHLSTLCKRAYPRNSRTGEPEHTAKTLKTSFIHSFYRIDSASFHVNDSVCVSAGAP